MSKQDALAFGLTAIWGAFATWIYWWLIAPVYGVLFWGSQPVVVGLLHSGWTVDQIKPYFHCIAAALAAVFYGFIFGFPLGLAAKRTTIVCWVIFVATFLVTLAARILFAPGAWGWDALKGNLLDRLYWLTFLATLMFLFLGRRLVQVLSVSGRWTPG